MRPSNGASVKFKVEDDLGNLQETAELTTSVPSQDLYPALGHCAATNQDFHCDFIIIRKFVDPEPSVSIGAEETA